MPSRCLRAAPPRAAAAAIARDRVAVGREVAPRVALGARAFAQHVVARSAGAAAPCAGRAASPIASPMRAAQHELAAEQLDRAHGGRHHRLRAEPLQQAGRRASPAGSSASTARWRWPTGWPACDVGPPRRRRRSRRGRAGRPSARSRSRRRARAAAPRPAASAPGPRRWRSGTRAAATPWPRTAPACRAPPAPRARAAPPPPASRAPPARAEAARDHGGFRCGRARAGARLGGGAGTVGGVESIIR